MKHVWRSRRHRNENGIGISIRVGKSHQLLGRGRVHANRAVEIRYFRAHFDGDGDALNDLAGGRVDNVNAEHSVGRCVDDDLVEGALVRLERGIGRA